MKTNYHLGLLYLVHLLMGADGTVSDDENRALKLIVSKENIDPEVVTTFQQDVRHLREREIYHKGIQQISRCTREEKLSAFVTLLKLSEVDGRVHLKEVKFLLYSLEHAGLEFDEVVNEAKESGYSL